MEIMGRFPKRQERSQEHGEVPPLVLVFSLPWVSFHQLRCLPCQHDLADGNTQLHLLGLVMNLRHCWGCPLSLSNVTKSPPAAETPAPLHITSLLC